MEAAQQRAEKDDAHMSGLLGIPTDQILSFIVVAIIIIVIVIIIVIEDEDNEVAPL